MTPIFSTHLLLRASLTFIACYPCAMLNVEFLVKLLLLLSLYFFLNYWCLIFLCIINFFRTLYHNPFIYTIHESSSSTNLHKIYYELYCRKVIKMGRKSLLKQSTQHKLISPFFPVLSRTSYSYTRFNPILYPPLMYLPFSIMNALKNWLVSLLPWESQLRDNFDEVPKRISWTARRELEEALRHKERNFL